MFSMCGPQTSSNSPSGNLVELQILSSQPRCAESDILGAVAQQSAF